MSIAKFKVLIYALFFSVNVTVRIEPPDAAILFSHTYIDLVCDVHVDSTNGANVSFNWTGPNGIVRSGSDFTITDQADNSTLRIQELKVNRDNTAEYVCVMTAVLDSDTAQGNNSVTLRVQGLKKLFLKHHNSGGFRY